jgi:hypothetical protein
MQAFFAPKTRILWGYGRKAQAPISREGDHPAPPQANQAAAQKVQVRVDCPACGAALSVNRNLAGTTIPCPQCAGSVPVQEAPPPAEPAPEPPRRAKQQEKKHPLPYSLNLLGAHAVLLLLAVACFAGAFLRKSWQPPEQSFFGVNPLILIGLGIGLVFAMVMAMRFPILATLGVVLGMLVLTALHYRELRVVDASRVIAISLAMVALWFAMEHRKVT